nr:MAG TPA: type IV secretory pathway protein [Caudoviricetes sp.]
MYPIPEQKNRTVCNSDPNFFELFRQYIQYSI